VAKIAPVKLGTFFKYLAILCRPKRMVLLMELDSYRLWHRFSAFSKGIQASAVGSPAAIFIFRRNIHRLEKGLSRQDIKPCFAEAYILETVKSMRNPILYEHQNIETLIWGKCVLDEYFSQVNHTQVVREAFREYSHLSVPNRADGKSPQPLKNKKLHSCSYDDFYKVCQSRKSVRDYKPEKVRHSDIQKAIAAAIFSPSACNRQTFKFLFFDDQKLVSKITKIPGGVKGYTIPNLIVIMADYAGFTDKKDFNTPLIDASLASMSLLLALESLGISSVCINWPAVNENERQVRKLIHIKETEFIVMLVGLGYPSEHAKVPFSSKRSIQSMLLVNDRVLES
jgi:nitroreductase